MTAICVKVEEQTISGLPADTGDLCFVTYNLGELGGWTSRLPYSEIPLFLTEYPVDVDKMMDRVVWSGWLRGIAGLTAMLPRKRHIADWTSIR